MFYFRFCRYLNATDVKVCDAIMGSGKTQAAIVEMDRCVDRRHVLSLPT